MRRDDIDFFIVPDHQLGMHDRLTNWAEWVSVRMGGGRNQAPIWCLGRSNGRQWHEPVLRPGVDLLDAIKMEKGVGALPIPHREALRWFYVWKTGPGKARRALGVTNEGLMNLVRDGRTMLVNRGA